MTDEAIATTVLDGSKNLGLKYEYLHGQGYDGSGSMAGAVRGASSVILRKHSLAVLVHCCSHVLNLAIANSCALPLVRNMMDSVTEVSKFFQHGKRQDKLEVIGSKLSGQQEKASEGSVQDKVGGEA